MTLEDELRELRLQLESLHQAIVDADEAVSMAEGIGLLEYLESEDGYAESYAVLNAVIEA